METPEFHSTAAKHVCGGEHFAIEDLLDFPNDEGTVSVEASMTTGPSAAVLLDNNSCNSSSSFPDFHAAGIVGPGDGQFASELCAPYDDVADDLEWLSNIVDESFCSEDLQKLQLLQGIQARTSGPPEPAGPIPSEMPVPGKARSKRSRAAPGNWTSRLLAVSASESEVAAAGKKKEGPAENDGRRCLHCATDRTPQWRTGPMGPKTLCNACGVRYKSGRLVPEYRPASSPTFVLTKHSNSHRKVLELRRQKEVQRAQQQFLYHHHHQSMMLDVSHGDDYLIHQHIGPDFRQLI